MKSIKLVSIGPPKCQEMLRSGLALGADTAIHVEIPDSAPPPEPLGVAKALQKVIQREKDSVDIVIMGKQAIDDDADDTDNKNFKAAFFPIILPCSFLLLSSNKHQESFIHLSFQGSYLLFN